MTASPQVSVVVDDMPRLVELVLEAVLSETQVGGLADVASVEAQAHPLHVHLPPRAEAHHARGSTLHTPDP